MAPIRETMWKGASYMVGVIREKAQIQYEEVYLKLETHARVFKVCISRRMASRPRLTMDIAIFPEVNPLYRRSRTQQRPRQLCAYRTPAAGQG